MKIRTLTPYENSVLRYTSDKETLFICETEISSFDVILPDAQSVREATFYFQKDDSGNILRVAAQFGQSINGVEKITIYGQYQTVLLISDGENYRMLQGTVPELSTVLPLGKWVWYTDSDGDLIQKVNANDVDLPPSSDQWTRKRVQSA